MWQDVLVYNVFTDLGLGNKWRILYTYMRGNDLLPAACDSRFASPAFDAIKHSQLGPALKKLYVMLTRAKSRLLIYDERWVLHNPGSMLG